MSKQEYKSAIRSKSYIKYALIKLLTEKDFGRITVTEVIETSGISRGTFYSHYKSLDDVINQIIDDEFNRLVNLIGENCDVYFNADNLLVLISKVFAYIQEDSAYYTGIILYNPVYDAVMKKISVKYKNELFRVLNNRCNVNSEEEANHIIIYAVGGIENEILKWAHSKTKLKAEIVVKLLVSTFMNFIVVK